MKVEQKLKSLGYEMKESPKPIAAYIPAKKAGNFVFTSGQIPMLNGSLVSLGRVGESVSEQEAYQAAQLCALNALKAIHDLIGDLDQITSIVKVVGYVHCSSSFSKVSQVINGASDFLVDVFGKEIGSHARSAVGVSSLPLGASCEIELIVAVKQS